MAKNEIYIPKKKSWTFLKEKENAGFPMDYETFTQYYRVFIIEASTKYYVNLFHPEVKNVVGRTKTNDADYADFVNNFKSNIDTQPPIITQPVDLINILKTGNKIQFHESSRPDTKDKKFNTVWSGRGDDIDNHIIWGGPELTLETEIGVSASWVDVKFDNNFGEVWLNGGYAIWENAKFGDSLDVHIVAPATPVYTGPSNDLIIEHGAVIRYSPMGPGTGTHSFAGEPVPIPNDTNTGWWQYDDNGFLPSPTQTGNFDLYTNEIILNNFIVNMPINGTTYSHVELKSSNSAKIPHPYFIRMKANNVGDSVWRITMFLILYRETTI